jgi:acetylornithine deacetylase/succinyl-diaminopimelate desuccinylase-like protein
LYGRGSADDGYSTFCALLAIKTCQEKKLGHPRCIIQIEGSEEGEIDDLVHYLKTYKEYLGNPDLVICLDAIANTTTAFWITSTLRGCANFDITVRTGTNHLHSGYSGYYPQAYPIMNRLLGRLVDFETQ